MADKKAQAGGHEVAFSPEQQQQIQQQVQSYAAQAEAQGIDLRGVDWGRVIAIVFELVGVFRKKP